MKTAPVTTHEPLARLAMFLCGFTAGTWTATKNPTPALAAKWREASKE